MTTTKASEFVEAARSYIGVPWKHQGRLRSGVDCIGLIVLAARDCGIDAPLAATYGRRQSYWQMKPYLTAFCDRIGQPEAGAVALYMSQAALHVGVLTGEGTVVQALNTVRRVTECGINFPLNQMWRPRWPQ